MTTFENRSDDDVLEELRAGSNRAFAELVRRHSPWVYRLALRLSANASDAEEILQEAFLRMHHKLDDFKRESKLSTWLHRITINAALMHARKHRRHAEGRLSEGLPGFDETGTLARLDIDYSLAARADELIEKRQLAQAVLSALDELPEEYRMPFVLRDLEELSTEETAVILGLSSELVRQRLHRARLMLRKHLSQLIGAE